MGSPLGALHLSVHSWGAGGGSGGPGASWVGGSEERGGRAQLALGTQSLSFLTKWARTLPPAGSGCHGSQSGREEGQGGQ